MLYFNTNVGATLVGKKSPFPLASPDSRSVLAVKGSLRRFAPWTAAGRSGETRCSPPTDFQTSDTPKLQNFRLLI